MGGADAEEDRPEPLPHPRKVAAPMPPEATALPAKSASARSITSTSPSAGRAGGGSPFKDRFPGLIGGRLISSVSSRSILSQKDVQGIRAFLRKPRKMIAVAIIVAMLARAVWFYRREERFIHDLMDAFDKGHDSKLNEGEMTNLLGANGVEFTQDQVKKLFGRVDDEGDGYDEEEMYRILSIVAELPVVSQRIRDASSARGSLWVDMAMCLVTGVGLAYIVGQSDNIEKKWAASSFRSAVQFRRMQNRCSKLDTELATLSQERVRLEEDIRRVEESSFSDLEERNHKLKRLGTRLKEVQEKQDEAKKALQEEVQKWQGEAEKCMREASLVKSKMERVMACVKGIDAFTGAGTNKFGGDGAVQGFCRVQSNLGFSMDTITFGTIENGQLMMYETAHSRKLGEGKDCAYRCTDLTSGSDYALKMYKIANPAQRHSIRNDLSAYKSQVSQHPRIVSYLRVIESDSMIFVLMDLLKGQDLFDVIATKGLMEDEARRLFRELVEALQHLHNNGVIHCDVKPENAMVVGDPQSDDSHLVLIDFGCSCFKRQGQGADGSVVFDAYMPPEHAENRGRAPAVSTDMWRLGCTLYVMLVRRPPFFPDAETQKGIQTRKASQFFRVPEFEHLSAEAKDLIGKLVLGDPAERLTTAQVLEHPWLAASS